MSRCREGGQFELRGGLTPWMVIGPRMRSKTPVFAALSVRGIRGSPRATVGGHPAGPGGAALLLLCHTPPLARPLWWPSSPNPFSRR